MLSHPTTHSGITDRLARAVLTGALFVLPQASFAQCLQSNLTPAPPNEPGGLDYYGLCGAIHGDFALVGAPLAPTNIYGRAGAVDFFRRVNTNWVHDGHFVPSDPQDGASFGSAADMDGNLAIVSAPWFSSPVQDNSGKVYLYVRTLLNQWAPMASFEPASSPSAADSEYGIDVSIDGDYFLVSMPKGPSMSGQSNPGSVYLYRKIVGWGLECVIHSPWADDDLRFGSSVAMQHGATNQDTLAVVGVPRYSVASPPLNHVGRVLIYSKPDAGNIWTEYVTIAPNDQQWNMNFGYSVAISGDTLVVGAPGYEEINEPGSPSGIGAIYIFKRLSGTSVWFQVEKVVNPDPVAMGAFGREVSIDNNVIVASSLGRAYVIKPTGSTDWHPEWSIQAIGGQSGFPFIGAQGISGSSVLVGHPHSGNSNQGSAAMYKLNAAQGANTCALAPLIEVNWAAGCTHTASRDGSSACDATGDGSDVWYRWMAPCDGLATFDTQYSDFDTVLSVHSQCPSDSDDHLLGCNDDAVVGTSTSAVTIAVQENAIYTIRIASKSADVDGSYILNMNFECGVSCPGDIAPGATGDGLVNVEDLLAVISAWGPCANPCQADINHNGLVDVEDLLAVINAWGACD